MKKMLLLFMFLSTFLLMGCGEISQCEKGESLIANRIYSPSTAVFSNCEEVKADGEVVVVKGVVDAQNKFGAMLREPRICLVNPGNTYECHLGDIF